MDDAPQSTAPGDFPVNEHALPLNGSHIYVCSAHKSNIFDKRSLSALCQRAPFMRKDIVMKGLSSTYVSTYEPTRDSELIMAWLVGSKPGMWQGPSTRSLLVQAQTVTKPHPHTERRAWYPLFSFPLDYHVISILDVTKHMLLLYSPCSFSWLMLEIDFRVWLHTLLCPSAVRYPNICLQLEQVTSIMAVHKGNNIYAWPTGLLASFPGSCQYSQCTAESWGRTWEQGYRCTIIMYKKTDVLNEGLDMVFCFFPLSVMADITARMKCWYFTKFLQ